MQKKSKIALALVAALGLPALAFAAGQGGEGKWAAKKAEILAKYDADHDGKLSPDERAKLHHDRAVEIFQKLDTNKDGVLSFEEFESGHKMMMMHHRRDHERNKDPNQQPPQ